MKVYNQEKTEILTEYDLTKGYLQTDTITRHIPAVKGVEEQSHYETVKEYPNGGKDVKKVIDVASVKTIPEHDEIEEIQVYVPYTEQELANIAAKQRIAELKGLLAATDYKAIKYAEGELTAEEYAETKAERQAWRAEINENEQRISDND